MIRPATPEDVPVIMQLIRELAEYEKAPHEVTNTEEQLLADGFGENPVFGAFLAEIDGKVVGMLLYYTRYSTWKAKRLYVEDIIVQEAFRGNGIGKKLLDTTIEYAKKKGFSGLNWQVLDWNEPAINFYKKYDVNFDTEWWNVSINF